VRPIVFLGGGRITTALIAGLHGAGYRKPIAVYDHHPAKLRQLKQSYDVEIERNLQDAVKKARMLVIAVRPDSVKELLGEIGAVHRPLIAVSLAAGIPLSRLRGHLGPKVGWVRAMPSPACRSGRGLTALAFDRRIRRSDRKEVTNLFPQVGPVVEISEKQFDAFTVAYSSSHGYHALATLADESEKLGLDRKSAELAAAHALADGILAWREENFSLDELLREAATPGGVAEAVVRSMDAAGYRRAIRAGLSAGLKRTRRNAAKV
jgi:pyrroline-5-carboxylate reductase